MPDMGTKTADETGAETGAEATTDEQKVSVAKTDEVTEAEDTTADDEVTADDEGELPEVAGEEGPTGVGQGAGAVVSAALGLVSLTGSWIGTVAAARETLVGQLQTSSTASVAKQVKEVYGDAWQTTALWGGLFALLALVVGVGVLARPAFGAPGKPQAVWIKSVAWGGVALGVVGLLLAVLKYTGILLDLPSTS
ncbi:integral membrane protein [Streptomyces sviceus ATCC 29083]|uniref:Integral membrane protein n=2 Tax=Streptomyces TaxID=1883 RepID=B5HMA5_STRX2|nr:integral membrane protein [Streptomyces sviceus ATCC 29083]